MEKTITPFKVAVDLIRAYAERGDDVDQFRKGGLGYGGGGTSVSVGGFMWLEDEPKGKDGRTKNKKIPNTKIIVAKIDGKLVNEVFDLYKVWDYVLKEKVQESLF